MSKRPDTRETVLLALELLKRIPNHRFGNDEDLKGLCALLASDASRHINGQAIAVDGGVSSV